MKTDEILGIIVLYALCIVLTIFFAATKKTTWWNLPGVVLIGPIYFIFVLWDVFRSSKKSEALETLNDQDSKKKPDDIEKQHDEKAEESPQKHLEGQNHIESKEKVLIEPESDLSVSSKSQEKETKNAKYSIPIIKSGFKRKLTAILSADAVEYSRLMSENEETTVRTLMTFKEVMTTLIIQHNGQVVDSPGDNLLAEFISVVDAVQCAVAIQKELESRNSAFPDNQKLLFRIGINLGDVIQEKDRIFGDGVNIASRLEGLADPGGICVSKTAFDHIESKLPYGYEFLGDQTVKNIAKPIGAYRVLMQPRIIASDIDKQRKVSRSKIYMGIVSATLAFLVIGAIAVWKLYFKSPSAQEKVALVDKKTKTLPAKPISEKEEIKQATKSKKIKFQNSSVTAIGSKKADKNPEQKFAHKNTEKMTDAYTKSSEPTDSLSKLIQKSKHKDENVRRDAIEELGNIRDPRAIEALVFALGDEDEQLKVQASMILWDIGKPAVEPLINAIQSPLPKVHCKAAQTLGLIKDPRAIDPLIEALSYNKVVRWCIEQALSGIGKPAVGRLTQKLKSNDPIIKASSARILAEMYPPAEEPLIEALHNKDIIVIAAAYKFYIEEGIKDSLPHLVKALNTSGDKSMAEAYLNSGNNQLRSAAIDWAESHGYRVNNFPGSGVGGRTKWGKNQ
jgi:adenylate cyclase